MVVAVVAGRPRAWGDGSESIKLLLTASESSGVGGGWAEPWAEVEPGGWWTAWMDGECECGV